ncbi:hypothetical protein D3C86_1733510 [compost metagenome]
MLGRSTHGHLGNAPYQRLWLGTDQAFVTAGIDVIRQILVTCTTHDPGRRTTNVLHASRQQRKSLLQSGCVDRYRVIRLCQAVRHCSWQWGNRKDGQDKITQGFDLPDEQEPIRLGSVELFFVCSHGLARKIR